jgi:hypothetical protein
MPKRKS